MRRPHMAFFLLVFALPIAFLIVGAATGPELLPGLPVGAPMAICPLPALGLFVAGLLYDPRITGIILAALAGLVTILWGSRTLARFRFA